MSLLLLPGLGAMLRTRICVGNRMLEANVYLELSKKVGFSFNTFLYKTDIFKSFNTTKYIDYSQIWKHPSRVQPVIKMALLFTSGS